jgi:hypothetical protein
VLFCVLRGALRFFDIYNLTYQKKKKSTMTNNNSLPCNAKPNKMIV